MPVATVLQPSISQAPPSLPRDGWKLIHVVIIILSLMMTITAYQVSKRQIDTRIEARFYAEAERVIDLLVERMGKYEDALWSGVASIDARGGDIDLPEWRIFSRSLRLEKRYPGINGIGVIHFVKNDAVPDYLAERISDDPDFEIYPLHEHDVFMPISFVEPEMTNAAAFGLDVAHETNRREAALESRDTGLARITGPIVLVQDEKRTPGFLFYAPFYDGGMHDTLAQRQQRALGAVYAPFVVQNLMEGLLDKDQRSIRLMVKDQGQLLYNELDIQDVDTDPNPMFRGAFEVALHGRLWKLDVETNNEFRVNNTYAQPKLVLAAGLVIEALIIALIAQMARTNRQAVSYANRLTSQLQDERNQLVVTNKELEQFSYVTSHDLKSPVRGIGGLADIIRDDLSEVGDEIPNRERIFWNLSRIQQRVSLMNRLTDGIIEFSQVGYMPEKGSLCIQSIIEDVRHTLGVHSQSLDVETSIDVINYDASNFKRIIFVLVENSVKHHHNLSELKIKIKINQSDEFFNVSIEDNGPGIDPRFHGRVFNLFETLDGQHNTERTGLGLAIAKKCVERNGSRIDLVSTQGNGATFSFKWPSSPISKDFLGGKRAA